MKKTNTGWFGKCLLLYVLVSTMMVHIEAHADEMQNEMKEAFRLYDKDSVGYISSEILKDILRDLDDQVTSGDLDGMLEELDSDGSGTVDHDEFMKIMTGE